MCVRENTSQPASVEFLRRWRRNYACSRLPSLWGKIQKIFPQPEKITAGTSFLPLFFYLAYLLPPPKPFPLKPPPRLPPPERELPPKPLPLKPPLRLPPPKLREGREPEGREGRGVLGRDPPGRGPPPIGGLGPPPIGGRGPPPMGGRGPRGGAGRRGGRGCRPQNTG